MVEQYAGKRIKFKNIEAQQRFLTQLFNKITIKEASDICECSERTLRDWRRGKFLPDAVCIYKLCSKHKHTLPSGITLVDHKTQLKENGRLGGLATMAKYGKLQIDENTRKRKWHEWWINKGKDNLNIASNKTLPFTKAVESADLAEFFGIVLGDGSVTRMQISITLNLVDDSEYSVFVEKLCGDLFGFAPSIQIRKYQTTKNIILPRVKLVEYLKNCYGLFIGHKVKQQVGVPDWIRLNDEYSIACVRGLMDTDGSIYTHKYSVKDREYFYKKICFTNASVPLREFVHDTLNELGIVAKYSGKDNVRVESQDGVKRYMRVVNTSNPKHLENYKK